jgi:hypothetical protein
MQVQTNSACSVALMLQLPGTTLGRYGPRLVTPVSGLNSKELDETARAILFGHYKLRAMIGGPARQDRWRRNLDLTDPERWRNGPRLARCRPARLASNDPPMIFARAVPARPPHQPRHRLCGTHHRNVLGKSRLRAKVLAYKDECHGQLT